MVTFSEEKTERLIKRAKELQDEGYNFSQLSKTFGVPEEWFKEHLDVPKKVKVKAHRYHA